MFSAEDSAIAFRNSRNKSARANRIRVSEVDYSQIIARKFAKQLKQRAVPMKTNRVYGV